MIYHHEAPLGHAFQLAFLLVRGDVIETDSGNIRLGWHQTPKRVANICIKLPLTLAWNLSSHV